MATFFKVVETLVLSLIVMLAPLKAIIVAIAVLVLIDTITGIMAAVKSKDPITSSRMKRVISKMFLYYSATVVGFIASTYLVDGALPLEKMITTLIGVVEVKSILENLDIISGGSMFKNILNKLDKE
jgi:hypothetical protein